MRRNRNGWLGGTRRRNEFRDRAKDALHFFSRTGTCMNAANNCVEYALREGRPLLSSLSFYFGIKRSRISNESKIAVNDCGTVEFRILYVVKINKSIGRTVMFVSEKLACFNLGRRACNDNPLCGIAAGTYNNAIMRFRRGYTAMTQEINVSTNSSHGRALCKKAHERMLFLEDGLILPQIFRRNIAVFKIFIGAGAKEIGIIHFEASGPTVETTFKIAPFRETMGESNKVIVKRPLLDGSIECLSLRMSQLISVIVLETCDEHAAIAMRFVGRRFNNRDIIGQGWISADAFDETLGLGCDRTEFHCIVGVPKNGRCILPQMIPVGKINEFKRIELGKLLAWQMAGNVIQDLNNPLLLIGHNGADYTTKNVFVCNGVKTERKNNNETD